jgi:hypothetical protein
MRRRRLLALIRAGTVAGLVALAFGVMPCDPEFCEKRCPICTKARQGNRFAQFLQRVEMLVTFGGCPWGRARQKKFGVRPDELIPIDAKAPD